MPLCCQLPLPSSPPESEISAWQFIPLRSVGLFISFQGQMRWEWSKPCTHTHAFTPQLQLQKVPSSVRGTADVHSCCLDPHKLGKWIRRLSCFVLAPANFSYRLLCCCRFLPLKQIQGCVMMPKRKKIGWGVVSRKVITKSLDSHNEFLQMGFCEKYQPALQEASRNKLQSKTHFTVSFVLQRNNFIIRH